jgi:drug/metabolite transporter (DMT)-like permease
VDTGPSAVLSVAAQAREKAPVAAGIFQTIVGVAAIAFGLLADAFYPVFLRRPKPDEKPMPKWLGRTICVAVGVVFILSGLSDMGITNSPTVATGSFQIFMGFVAIVLNLMRRPDEKPTWLARTFFVVVGVAFILSGLSDLRRHYARRSTAHASCGLQDDRQRVREVRARRLDGKVVL